MIMILSFVQVKAASRKSQLDNAFMLQTFLADSRDLVSLILYMCTWILHSDRSNTQGQP